MVYIRDAFVLNGKLLMLPYTGGPIAMYYNVNLLAEKGLSVPPKNWTFDDFIEYASKLTGFTGNKLVSQGANMGVIIGRDQWWLWGYGGSILDKSNRNFMLGSPESIKAMRAMADLEKRKWATSYDLSMFASGKAGFATQGSWMITQYQVKFPFEAVHVPTGPIGRKQTAVYVNGWGIMQASKHKKEAWNLIKYLVSKEWQVVMTNASSELPALASAVPIAVSSGVSSSSPWMFSSMYYIMVAAIFFPGM